MHYPCKDRTIAIIVVYNPDEILLKNNINILQSQVNDILIVNNSDNLRFDLSREIKVINNNNNLGVATALNIGIKFAINNNFRYALLLDQDSTPATNFADNLMKGFSLGDSVAMSVPQIVYFGINKKDTSLGEHEFVKFAITSGSLLDLSLIPQIGIFDDNLFIDSVDFDYCFKIRIKNFKIVRINRAILYQRLGNMAQHKLAGISFYPTNHNYIRRYYIVRNRLYLGAKYYSFDKLFLWKSIIRIIYELVLVILFEDDKIKKIQSAKRAFFDFCKGRMGKFDNSIGYS